MSRKNLTSDELFQEWKKREQAAKEENERKIRIAKSNIPRECKNCKHSWYKQIPPRGSFTTPTEYCGCRKKSSLVDPKGFCDEFFPK